MNERIWIEDALKYMHESAYRGEVPTVEGIAGALGIRPRKAAELMNTLQASGLVERREGRPALTGEGRDYARHVLRAHRLYETFLARETGYDEASWHRRADAREHSLSDDEVARMARRLGDPRFDPHGDPIPTAAGQIPPLRGQSLLDCPPGWGGRVVHIEDEPPAVYQQLAASGLAPGIALRVAGRDDRHVRLRVEGKQIDLKLGEAGLVQVVALAEQERLDESVERLSALRLGEQAEVVGLSPACVGPERNRLLDLGVVAGTKVVKDMVNPAGSPAAYRIRGALIGLRAEQSEKILIRRSP